MKKKKPLVESFSEPHQFIAPRQEIVFKGIQPSPALRRRVERGIRRYCQDKGYGSFKISIISFK